jgi:hypothetical protein
MESLLTPKSKHSSATEAKKLNNNRLDLAVASFLYEIAIP